MAESKITELRRRRKHYEERKDHFTSKVEAINDKIEELKKDWALGAIDCPKCGSSKPAERDTGYMGQQITYRCVDCGLEYRI